jgi:hypothetical protein
MEQDSISVSDAAHTVVLDERLDSNCFGWMSGCLLVSSHQTSCLKLTQLEETPDEMANREFAECAFVGCEFAAEATAGWARLRRVRIKSPLLGKAYVVAFRGVAAGAMPGHIGQISAGQTTLRFLDLLCRRSLLTSDITSASFYATTNLVTPTLLIDEKATAGDQRA